MGSANYMNDGHISAPDFAYASAYQTQELKLGKNVNQLATWIQMMTHYSPPLFCT